MNFWLQPALSKLRGGVIQLVVHPPTFLNARIFAPTNVSLERCLFELPTDKSIELYMCSIRVLYLKIPSI
jgi:hypothetical protein